MSSKGGFTMIFGQTVDYSGADAAGAGVGIAVLLIYLVVLVANYGFVIWSILDVRKHSDAAWQVSNQNKSLWQTLTVVALCVGGWLIALIYVLAIRPKVIQAEQAGGAGGYPPV